MRYTLMCKEREVLEFDIEFPDGAIRDVRPLEGAAWAPLGVLDNQDMREWGLAQFVDSRGISFTRADLPAILEATGAQSAVELAFRSGGFSLSDPYWYRSKDSALTWSQGNFFDNEWDPAFGDAVLRRDYRALERASIATPDITCSGSSRKAWIRDEKGPLLLKASVEDSGASMLAEALVSRMLARILPANEFVSYELAERDGETYSVCRPVVNAGEELSMAWQAVLATDQVVAGGKLPTELLGFELLEVLSNAYSRWDIEGAVQFMAKAELITHLAFYRDIHPHNMGVIRSIDSNALRLAPFFDFDRAFGLSRYERMEEICAHPQITALLVASMFSNLDPSWDYSWYAPDALDGFEHDIERTLSECDVIPRGFAQLAASLFVAQRAYVNSVVVGEWTTG